jgi:hypothetical protein
MSRFDNRPKLDIKQKKDDSLKGTSIFISNNGKVEKSKKMFYLPKVIIRALEIQAFEDKTSESDICKKALESFLRPEAIEKAEKEINTL